MMETIKKFAKLSNSIWVTGGLLLLCLVAFLDYFTGNELSFSFFYLIPIAILSWATNGKMGIAIAFISAGVWLVADILSGAHYSSNAIYIWNAVIRFGFFLLVVLLIQVGKAWEFEKGIARTDYLTGALNSRAFNEIAQLEINRSRRYQHPLTIAFIDIDDFKTINDQFGHTVGDLVLETVTRTMQKKLRKTDIVARMGGDEFAILLPETNAIETQIAISKMQHALITEMKSNFWHVTLSIGVITYNTPPVSADDMLNMADKIMYSVKNNGKNNVSYITDTHQKTIKTNIDQSNNL